MTFPMLLAADGSILDLAKETGTRFGFAVNLFVAQCISFALVAFLLHRFAYKPILTVLEERRKKIADGLANAEKIRHQLADAEKQFSDKLAAAGVEAQRIIEEAREAGSSLRERKTQEAIAEAEGIIAKAREATQLDRDRIMSELKREVGRLVIETTGKVTGKVLTSEDQRRLSEETARELAA